MTSLEVTGESAKEENEVDTSQHGEASGKDKEQYEHDSEEEE